MKIEVFKKQLSISFGVSILSKITSETLEKAADPVEILEQRPHLIWMLQFAAVIATNLLMLPKMSIPDVDLSHKGEEERNRRYTVRGRATQACAAWVP